MKTDVFKKSFKIVVGLTLLLSLIVTPMVGVAQEGQPYCTTDISHSSWVTTFNFDFAPGYWDVGLHSIVLMAQFPDQAPFIVIPSLNFDVVETAPLFKDNVEFNAIFHLLSSEGIITQIHPDQDTHFIVRFAAGNNRQEALEFIDEVRLWISVDGGEFMALSHGPITVKCAINTGSSRFVRDWEWGK